MNGPQLSSEAEAFAYRVYWWCVAGFEESPPFSPRERFTSADLEASVRACFPRADVTALAFVILARASYMAEEHFTLNRRSAAHASWSREKRAELVAAMNNGRGRVDCRMSKAELVRALVDVAVPRMPSWAAFFEACLNARAA